MERKKPGYPCELNDLADHLKKRILDLGITQKDVARRMGLDKATLTAGCNAAASQACDVGRE
jgi:plasmid maintenance system antidote protein VapI